MRNIVSILREEDQQQESLSNEPKNQEEFKKLAREKKLKVMEEMRQKQNKLLAQNH